MMLFAAKLRWASVAFAWLVFVRLSLSLVGYRRLEGWLRRSHGPTADRALADRVAWAVSRAACWVPRATCLPQALVARQLLAMNGYSSVVHIGVAAASNAPFRAHAWLRSGDLTIVGGDDEELTDFRPLIKLGEPL